MRVRQKQSRYIIRLSDLIILPNTMLPRRFQANQRRNRIFDFIQKTKELSESAGYFGLDEFISFDTVLQKELNGILSDIEAYVDRTTIRRPFNIFVQAPPGSGKSFLVKSLIKAVAAQQHKRKAQFPFLEANLSNISSYHELVMFLDTVHRRGRDGKVPFVLFDEIDAEMPGFNFFQRMLMPMWDGAYLWKGARKTLPPTVFFFAGTPEGLRYRAIAQKQAGSRWMKFVYGLGLLMSGGLTDLIFLFSESFAAIYRKVITIEADRQRWPRKQLEKLELLTDESSLPKFGDFFDRIDHFIFLPPLTLYFTDCDKDPGLYFADREMIYFFATRICKAFPTVTKISRAALAIICSQFYRSKRMMERAIFLSRVSSNASSYSLQTIPRAIVPSTSEELNKWIHDFPGEIKIIK